MAYLRVIRSQWDFFIQMKGLLWACAYRYVSLVQEALSFINVLLGTILLIFKKLVFNYTIFQKKNNNFQFNFKQLEKWMIIMEY